jgi:galactose mutarotase-like enzyme
MPKFQNQDVVEISSSGSLLRFAPQAGGRLLSWDLDGASVIHWPDTADWSRPAGVRGGNPLLFPFLGRHRVDGQIGFWKDAQGVVRQVPMHGFARDLPFAYEVFAEGEGVRMWLTDSEATRAGYPFGFRFETAYQLIDPATLEVTFVTSNTGDARLPYYAGHHFYFTLPREQRGITRLELPATQFCRQRPDGTITEREPGLASYRFDAPEIVDRFHCLDGVPQQPVRIFAPGLQRVIEIDLQQPGSVPWYVVTSWTESDQSDFYCVEPWLGLPDAIHNGQGLRWLEPGQTETATLRITVDSLD